MSNDIGQNSGKPGRAKGRILVVDDERRACSALTALLSRKGYEATSASNPFRGLDLLGTFEPDVVLTDLRMPGLDGLAFMERVQRARPEAVFVVMTAYGSIDIAVEAVKRGAENFIEKPIDVSTLYRVLEGAMERALLRAEGHSEPRNGTDERLAAFRGIVAEHPLMRAVLHLVEQAAPTRATVLLTGESGTGKGLIAQAIHRLSPRAGRRFVDLNCAALAESVLESELFGHEKGAFTGALTRREGRFMLAAGGTLYLDEIAETSLAIQVKLLRFLQDRKFERVGGNTTHEVDVRLVTATNRNLEAEIDAGRFREDLFYRLDVFRIHLPPLRERRSDIPALAGKFLKRFATEYGKRLEGFSTETLDQLLAYAWPGNVRELEHAIERAAIMTRGPRVKPQHLPPSISSPRQDPLEVTIPGSKLSEIERAAILKSVLAVNGKAADAAEMLGISRSKIHYRLREYGH